MLKAYVLVCVLAFPSDNEICTLFEDQWGPYMTDENCQIRVNQMTQELYTALSPMFVITSVEGACVSEEGQLS